MSTQSPEFVREQIEASQSHYFTCEDAEANILRQIMKHVDMAGEVVNQLSHDDFTNNDYKRIYHCIEKITAKKREISPITIDTCIHSWWPDVAETTVQTFLGDILHYNPDKHINAYHAVGDHIAIVKQLSQRRSAIAKFDELVGNLRDPTKEIGEVLTEIQLAAVQTGSSDAKWMNAETVGLNTYTYLERRQTGEIKSVKSNIGCLDRLTGGFFGGELTVIAARPAVGKSAFGLNLAMGASHLGARTGIVSCEMVDIGFGQRMLSKESWVSGNDLRNANLSQEQWDKIGVGLTEIGELKIDFMFPDLNPGGMTIENVSQSVRTRAANGEMDMLIIDYIGILQSEKRFREDRDRVKYITSELKKLSISANIPVIALCQVNRDAHGSLPTMAQLRDSGSVEQDADNIIFLHIPTSKKDPSIRDCDREGFVEGDKAPTKYLVVNVAKQRNGRTGTMYMSFDPDYMRYVEFTDAEEQRA